MKKRKKKESSIEKDGKWMKGLTKEEIIAANKAKVAKFHPEPVFSSMSSQYAKALLKQKHEKAMLEKAKKIWYSIVSVPMGGMKK